MLNLQVLKGLSLWLNELRNAGTVIFGYNLANLPTQLEPAKYERMVFGLILVLMMIFRPAGHPARAAPAPRARASPDMAVLLEARGVTKRFGGLTALNDGGLRRSRKATSPRSSAPTARARPPSSTSSPGIYVPEEGAVTFRGTPLLGRRPDQITALGICRTFQNIRLFAQHDRDRERAGGHARRVPLELLGRAQPEPALARARSRRCGRGPRELLDVVGLRDKANELARNLPYGDQRRLEIGARARLEARRCCCSTSRPRA